MFKLLGGSFEHKESLLQRHPSTCDILTYHPNTNDSRRVYNFLWSEIQNYIAEADADLIPVPGQLDLHGRCRYGVLLAPCFGALYLLQI